MDRLPADGPRYRALAEAIEAAVRDGELAPGQRLPTHRELAEMLGVTVGTITRGYAEAERKGLVKGTIGRGTFVTAETGVASIHDGRDRPQYVQPGGVIEMDLATPLDGVGDPDLAEGLRRLAETPDVDKLLHYQDATGHEAHRVAGSHWLARFGLDVPPDDVVICAGGQHSLACVLAGLFRESGPILTGALTYPGLKTLARTLGVGLVPVEDDEHGPLPEAVAAAVRREGATGLYLMPTVDNPTTACIPLERREELAEVAERLAIRIVEDDAYAMYRSDAPPPLAVLARERTVHVASPSKVLGGGLRVAYVAAPADDRLPLIRAVQNTLWMTPPLMVELAARWVLNDQAERCVAAKTAELRRRHVIADDILHGLARRGFPESFYIWLELPEPWTGQAFEAAARRAGVGVFAAERFHVAGGRSLVPRAARVSLSGPRSLAELRRGLKILRELLSEPGLGAPVF